MTQKNASPNKRQIETLVASGKQPTEWVVEKELQNTMIIRQRGSEKYEVIKK